jgi:hypothetical protein
MGLSAAQWKKYRSRFAWVFAISFVVFVSMLPFVGHFQPTSRPYESPSPQQTPHIQGGGGRRLPPLLRPPPAGRPQSLILGRPSSLNLAVLVSVASLLTSGTTLVGFFIATTMAWRKERRERQQSELDLEMKRLELEKLRRDLEHQKQESSRPPSKPNDVAQ